MPSPLHGNRAPFKLLSDVVYFHDWRYVDPGRGAWRTEYGESAPLFSMEKPPPMHLEPRDTARGVRLVAQKPRKDRPVLTPEDVGEMFLFGGTVIRDQGRYRFWFECWPPGTRAGFYNYLRYAESDDGVQWRMPSLGLIEYDNSRENNIVYGAMLTGERGYHGGSVFKDPSAPPSERYKLIHLGLISPKELERFRRKRPDAVDPFNGHFRNLFALYGAVSPDGLRWTPIPEPLVAQVSDTHNVCEYDVLRKKYVAYCRSWFFERRTIGRMETDDFRRFPLPEELFWPNAMMGPSELWYANAKTMMPGTLDYHVMFPLRWRLKDDSFDFHLATSPDGIVWGFVPGGPICEPGEPGAWDQGTVAPGLGLVELPGDRMGILYAGSPLPHKHPRTPPLGKLAWAWWPKGRLVALEAPEEGSFILHPLQVRGRRAVLNFRTSFAGHILVESVGPDGMVIEGRSFDDCDRLRGDHLDRPITWKGRADLGHTDGAPVRLRFRLRNAQLFSVSFQ